MKLKMVRLLSKVLAFVFLFAGVSVAQNTTNSTFNTADYKDPEQFEKFRKRKDRVAAWQINQLKEGALVVRLRTQQTLIDELIKKGDTKMALEKRAEQYAINKNTVYAFKDYFNFCKVYFIYSNFSDSLLNGARAGFFLDSNMNIDPTIRMDEKFYLLAERDYGYNSSIGFVPEDSARKVVETGNPVREMAVVLKNKYGHQLKGPFPYQVKEKNFMDAGYDFPITVKQEGNDAQFDYTVNKTYLADLKQKDKGKAASSAPVAGNSTVKIKKQFTYEKIALAVDQLNDQLNQFYRKNSRSDASADPSLKPFLY
jgi:hypothetical protein